MDSLRLKSGILFPIPVTLDVSQSDIEELSLVPGARITLRDPRDDMALAIFTGAYTIVALCNFTNAIRAVQDVYHPDKEQESTLVFGTKDELHPAVAYLQNRVKELYLGGSIQAISLPVYHDYVALRCKSRSLIFFFIVANAFVLDTPAELRAHFKKLAWRKVVAFQVSVQHSPLILLENLQVFVRLVTPCIELIGN